MAHRRTKIKAVILAAGDGKRIFSCPVPKQLIELQGRPVVSYCLDVYQNLDVVEAVTLVVHEKYASDFQSIIARDRYSKVKDIVNGGECRQDSIFLGLTAMEPCDLVIIQNANAIFNSTQLIRLCIAKAKIHKAVSAFSSEAYTSFTFADGRVDQILDRRCLGHVRDPQVFDYKLLLDLHRKARIAHRGPYTNDVVLAREFGQEVFLVESHSNNIKITTDIDFLLADAMLSSINFSRPKYLKEMGEIKNRVYKKLDI